MDTTTVAASTLEVWTIGGTQTSSPGPVSGTAAGNFFSVSASLVASSVGCECCVPVWNTSCEPKALTRRPSGAPSLCPQFHAHKHVAATPMPLSQPEPPVPRKGVALGIECLRAQRMEKNVMATSRVPRKTTLWKLSAAPCLNMHGCAHAVQVVARDSRLKSDTSLHDSSAVIPQPAPLEHLQRFTLTPKGRAGHDQSRSVQQNS